MKTKQITIRGWANDTDYLFNENTGNSVFMGNFRAKERELLKSGYKELNRAFDTLRGKNATERIDVYGWYWRGSWSDPQKQIFATFYK